MEAFVNKILLLCFLLLAIVYSFKLDKGFQHKPFSNYYMQQSFISSNAAIEVDYLGTLNFCLRAKDSALSGPSRSKVLNALTNSVFKAIMIGNEEYLNQVVRKMDAYRSKIRITECILGDEDGLLNNAEEKSVACAKDLLLALIYVQSLENLLTLGESNDVVIGGIYDQGFRRLLTTLKDGGCIFNSKSGTPPKPLDNNICLSLIDSTLPANIPTKTRELNIISNWVSRAMLYGEQRDRNKLAISLEAKVDSFAERWTAGDTRCQEIAYLRALVILLKEGIEEAENSITYAPATEKFGFSNITGNINDIGNFEVPSLRLFDMYQCAFQRVVSVVLKELGSRTGNVPLDEEVLETLSLWEQNMRGKITDKLWNKNPLELVGKWEMIPNVDTTALAKNNNDMLKIGKSIDKVIIEFKKEGTVDLFPPRGAGFTWNFKPGPAHLDTCEFSLTSTDENNLVLQYVGYIDRGQRVESRFSGRPISMAGRVTSLVKGEVRGSMRFSMILKKLV